MRKIFSPLLLVAVFFAGCAQSPIDYTVKKSLSPGESVVFGRVKVLKGEDEVDWDSILRQKFELRVIRGEAPEFVDYKLTDKGYFYWSLPPDKYIIAGFQWGTEESGRIFMSFIVPKGEPIVYVGTLTIYFSGLQYRMKIDDDEEETVKLLRKKFPEIKGEPARHIMEWEKPR